MATKTKHIHLFRLSYTMKTTNSIITTEFCEGCKKFREKEEPLRSEDEPVRATLNRGGKTVGKF